MDGWKTMLMVGRLCSFWDGLFSGAMIVRECKPVSLNSKFRGIPPKIHGFCPGSVGEIPIKGTPSALWSGQRGFTKNTVWGPNQELFFFLEGNIYRYNMLSKFSSGCFSMCPPNQIPWKWVIFLETSLGFMAPSSETLPSDTVCDNLKIWTPPSKLKTKTTPTHRQEWGMDGGSLKEKKHEEHPKPNSPFPTPKRIAILRHVRSLNSRTGL